MIIPRRGHAELVGNIQVLGISQDTGVGIFGTKLISVQRTYEEFLEGGIMYEGYTSRSNHVGGGDLRPTSCQ